jgi:hypothetical protein
LIHKTEAEDDSGRDREQIFIGQLNVSGSVTRLGLDEMI